MLASIIQVYVCLYNYIYIVTWLQHSWNLLSAFPCSLFPSLSWLLTPTDVPRHLTYPSISQHQKNSLARTVAKFEEANFSLSSNDVGDQRSSRAAWALPGDVKSAWWERLFQRKYVTIEGLIMSIVHIRWMLQVFLVVLNPIKSKMFLDRVPIERTWRVPAQAVSTFFRPACRNHNWHNCFWRCWSHTCSARFCR